MSNVKPRRPPFISSIIYRDKRAALEWLHKAFGFEVSEMLMDPQGNIAHAEMTHGDGIVMIGDEWVDWARSPASIGGRNTQRIHVHLEAGIDEHCARARAAGATIVMEPNDQFYGERTYIAADLDGHHWTFSQTVKHLSKEDMEKASGFKFKPLA